MNHRRPWYQFSLRTFLVVMILMSAGFGYWVHWSREWIRQRQAAFSIERYYNQVYDPDGTPAPMLLRPFGEEGRSLVWCENPTPENLAELKRLFPEAQILP